jgi:hypothetical protein
MKNDSAFPNNFTRSENQGMTQRAYFAGLAMQSIIAGGIENEVRFSEQSVATGAVAYADALIAALEADGIAALIAALEEKDA